MKVIGDYIGGGSVKGCYKVKGYPQLVVLLGGEKSELLCEEHDLLRLRKMGIPALHVRVVKVQNTDGETDWGLMAPKYDFHSLCSSSESSNYSSESQKDAIARLKPGHLRNLEAIRRKLIKKKVSIADLQFLFRGDSEVVINDPCEVYTRSDSDSIRCNSQAIRAMIRSAKNNK
jgi:hypothetical protein